jgi:thiamine-monophosphate kinase
MKLSERAIIERLRHIFQSPPPPEGMGDDAAFVRGRDGLLLSTDMMFQSTHFPRYYNSWQSGYMAAAANISDIAAMGGTPSALLVSLGVPPRMRIEELTEFARGVMKCSRKYGAKIIGGDTKAAKEFTVCMTAVGLRGKRILTRAGAKKGHLLAVTGKLGAAAADELAYLSGEVKRPFLPEPRVSEGRMLAERLSASSAIDITDGLAVSAHYLAEQSVVRMEIDFSAVPIAHRLRRYANDRGLREAVLYWGGDYQLLFTLPANKSGELKRVIPEASIIGKVCEGSGVYITYGERRERARSTGYDAFGARKNADILSAWRAN